MDTSVLVAAIRSDAGASRRLVVAILGGRPRMLVSVPLMLEYQSVLSRREHLASSGLTTGEMETILDALAAVSEPVRIAFLWRPQLRDPADDMVLETAVNGRAGAIVTFNQRDFAAAEQRFGIEVISPAETLRRLHI